MTESEEASLRSILADLTDLFGWEDKTPLHAALHVRNAVLNLRADLAVAQDGHRRFLLDQAGIETREKETVELVELRAEVKSLRLNRAGMDDLLARVEQGAKAVERDKIVAWLRTAPCDSPGHDPRWCQDCQVRECAADAIEDGVHRKPGDEVEAIRALRALLVAPRG